jgi:hypothetical protein
MAWQFFTFNGFSNDHYVHVARAQQMLLGEWPVRDFVDPGMPLMYVISAAARLVIGEIVGAEFAVVALGIGIGAAATVIAASRLSRSVVVAGAVALLEILASPRSYSYPKMMLYGLAGCAIVAVAENGSRRRILLAAVLTATAFLIRHDHGLYIGLASTVAMVLSAPDWRGAVRRVAGFGVVVVALLLPWVVAVQYYQGLSAYLESAIAFSRREADLSLLRRWPVFQIAGGVTIENAHAWLFDLFWALPVVSLLLAAWRRLTRRERWAGESAAVAGLAVMALLVDAGFLRNPLTTRIADATVPASMLGAWLLGLAWTWDVRPMALAVVARAASVVILAVTTVAIWESGDVTNELDEVGVFNDLEAVEGHVQEVVKGITSREMDAYQMPSRVSGALVPFFHFLERCTAPSDRLLVSGMYPDVYVLAQRGFAGGHAAHLEAFYSSDLEQSITLARMQRASVPFVVLVLEEERTFNSNFPKLVAHIEHAYSQLADVPVDGMKPVRLLVERNRRPTHIDAATKWPCFR